MITDFQKTIIDNHKSQFWTDLSLQFCDIGIRDVGEMASEIDSVIQIRVIQCFLSDVGMIFDNEEIMHRGKNYFGIKKHIFEITSGVNEKTQLFFTCLGVNAAGTSITPKTININLEKSYRFDECKFLLPTELPCNENYISELVKGIFQIGYRWLGYTINLKVSEAISDTKGELYAYIKGMIDDETYLEGFWFSALVYDQEDNEKKDVIILDQDAVQASLKISAKNFQRGMKSPEKSVTEMATEIVGQHESVIHEAVQRDEDFEIDLTSGSYYQNNTSFNLAMRAIWGESVSCFPIIDANEIAIVSFYRPQYKSYLSGFLERNHKNLQDLALRNLEDIKRGLATMKEIEEAPQSKTMVNWRTGEFFGGLLGGVIKTMGQA